MTIEILEPFPANSNPFRYDLERMGVVIGANVVAMMMNHKYERCSDAIIVDTNTGQRIRITFAE